jgi:hypothetical protein
MGIGSDADNRIESKYEEATFAFIRLQHRTGRKCLDLKRKTTPNAEVSK